jgi:hypothetical protein
MISPYYKENQNQIPTPDMWGKTGPMLEERKRNLDE